MSPIGSIFKMEHAIVNICQLLGVRKTFRRGKAGMVRQTNWYYKHFSVLFQSIKNPLKNRIQGNFFLTYTVSNIYLIVQQLLNCINKKFFNYTT